MEHYQSGNEFFVDEAYDEALKEYNKAIDMEKNADFYVKRAACHLKLQDYMKALQDSNSAISLKPDNPTAFLRKGIACFEMEEYESAKEAFDLSRKFNDTALVRRWIRKCDAEIEEEEGGAVHVNQKTSAPTSFDVKSIPSVRAEDTLNDPIIPVKTSIRHEWYQSPTNVVITVYARNKAKEDCKVDAKETTLSINIKLSEDSDFVLDLNLCDTIYPEQTKIECYPTKVEVKLTKKKQCKWLTLEKSEKEQISTLDWDTSGIMKPEYPSSSKIKKNWDAIDKSVEEEKLQGEQALNKVFQDIFSRGSDEQRRAMEKSFVESGGTVLSTNWEDVGSRYVEGSAPKGAELKKWNE